jgi:hypothetical protein
MDGVQFTPCHINLLSKDQPQLIYMISLTQCSNGWTNIALFGMRETAGIWNAFKG